MTEKTGIRDSDEKVVEIEMERLRTFTNHVLYDEQMHMECISDCDTVCIFLKLTDEMVKTILELNEELIRWRQALIKYLPPEWADGLQQDIFNNTSHDFEGDPAYDLYVRLVCGGQDPQQVASRIDRLHRLARGTDETSITYL